MMVRSTLSEVQAFSRKVKRCDFGRLKHPSDCGLRIRVYEKFLIAQMGVNDLRITTVRRGSDVDCCHRRDVSDM